MLTCLACIYSQCANHTQHLAQNALAMGSGAFPRENLKICAAQIESTSSFGGKL